MTLTSTAQLPDCAPHFNVTEQNPNRTQVRPQEKGKLALLADYR